MLNSFTADVGSVVTMNKTTLASAIILSFFVPLFLGTHQVIVEADPRVWTVKKGGGADFETIQEAVDNVTYGSTILVYSGTYFENVAINKSLSIIGADRDHTIIDGNGTGNVILVRHTTDLIIKNFTIRRSGTENSGISLRDSDRIEVSHNLITDNFYGIRIRGISSFDNLISGNIITGNENGIVLESCSFNLVSFNEITQNFWGIVFLGSLENEISNNIISSNTNEGILFVTSVDNLVSGNDIKRNNPGIYFYMSSNNIVYHNNFNNTDQISSNGTGVNYWDNGLEGNYWSNYEGVDSDKDGIGNTPHFIDENNTDNYPLMGFFSILYIVSEAETYHVSTICNETISDLEFKIGSETGNRVIQFSVKGKEATVAFCRVMIPKDLMKEPYIILTGIEEINSTRLEISNETYVYLYLPKIYDTVSIISSRTWHFYYDLIDKIATLEEDLWRLNGTYRNVQSNCSQLQRNYLELNDSYYDFLDNYAALLANWTQLQSDHFEGVHNTENLTYSFAALTAIFLIVTVYLSKHAHLNKNRALEDKRSSPTITP